MTDRYEMSDPGDRPDTPAPESDEITAPVLITPPVQLTPPAPPVPSFPTTYPPYLAPTPPVRKRRLGLIVGIVLAVVLLLCAGGGVAAYYVVQNAQPVGQADPEKATRGFLTAIYTNHDVDEAVGFVCPDARDTAKLTKVINDLTAFEQKFDTPTVTWDTPVISTEKITGTAHVSLTLTTEDERVAHKKLVLDLLNSRGWWVCDVRPES